MKPIIDATTDADTVTIKLDKGIYTISAGKLATTEVVTFQLEEEGVSVLGDLYQDDAIRQLTATHNAMTIQGPIDLQVSKSATAAAVGVYMKG
jgi:hypothetical protein